MRLSRIAVVVGCLAVCACNRDRSARDTSLTNAPPPAGPTTGSNAPGDLPPPAHATVPLPGGRTIADVAARVTPSVVNVFSDRRVSNPELSPFGADPFFHFFFDRRNGARQAPAQRERSLGSGVIVRSDGVILTNNHVVERGDK